MISMRCPLLLIFLSVSFILWSIVSAQTPSSPLNVSIYANGNCSIPLSTIQAYPTWEYWASLVPPSVVVTERNVINDYDHCVTINYNTSSFQIVRNSVFTCILPNSTSGQSGYFQAREYLLRPPISPCRANPFSQIYGTLWTSFNTCLPFGSWSQTNPSNSELRNTGSIIVHSCPTSSPPIPPAVVPNSGSNLTPGVIAAITISVVVIILLVIAGFCYYRRPRALSAANGREKAFSPLTDD